MKQYKITPEKYIHVIEGPFKGLIYSYGRVKTIEQEENLILSFEYDIISGDEPDDFEGFKQFIGDILMDILREQLAKHEVVYCGGTD